MSPIDPATGTPLPADAIQRILFLASPVHVYTVPPLASTKGYSAASWTADPSHHIFTARCRVIETSYEDPARPDTEVLKVDVVLEDPATGELFAAAPYADESAVEPVIDSSRFFVVRVRDPSGRKAVLGVGFEERSEAFDFGVALQEARKAVLGPAASSSSSSSSSKSAEKTGAEDNRDLSLKEGETITVNFGGSRLRRQRPQESAPAQTGGDLSAFSLAPPPSASGGGGNVFLPPPPPPATGTQAAKHRRRLSAQQLGFDDGKFGEFA